MGVIEKYKIFDNINLYVICDDKYKTVYSSTYVHRLLKREEVTYNSLLSKVLKMGTKLHPSLMQLSKYAESLFGCAFDVSTTKRANVQSLVSSVSTVADRFTGTNTQISAYTLMLDLLFKPNVVSEAFSSDIVASQKSNLKDDIDGLINDKRAYSSVRCLEEMCKGEPNAIVDIGYKEDIDDINENNLYNHYQSIIFSSPIDIFVVGNVDAEALIALTRDYLKDFTFNISPISVECSNSSVKEVKYVEDNMDVNQGKLAMGLRTGINIDHPDYYALLTANSIFGSGAHSKLFNNVREAMSLCYYAYSRLDKYNSLMLVGSGIEFANFEKTKNAILAELENVKNGNFTQDELSVAKEYIISSYRSYNDSPSMLVDYYMGTAFNPSLPTLDQACKRVASVTKEDAIRAFEKVYLDTVYFLNGKEDNK